METSTPQLVTMMDVAREAGVAKATVCRALKGRAEVSEKTRQRVLVVADRLGYQPDPNLSALVNLRWAKARTRAVRHLALLHAYGGPANSSKGDGNNTKVARHILQRAADMGFLISEFDLREEDHCRQVAHTMHHRGIDGLILNVEGPVEHWPFPWEKYSCVSIGFEPSGLPEVTSDYLGAMQLAVKEVLERGYRRIGFAHINHENPGIDYRLASSTEMELRRIEEATGNRLDVYKIPGLTTRIGRAVPWKEWLARFQEWYERTRPDVVIDGTMTAVWWMRDLGIDVPGECGYVKLKRGAFENHDDLTAVETNVESQANWAVDLVATMIRSNMRGIPDHPPRLTIPVSWHEGRTLRPRAVAETVAVSA